MISNQETLNLSPYMAIYDIGVPKDNMLRQINELVDFTFEALLRVDSDRGQWSRGEQDLISKGEPYLTKVILHYNQARDE